MSESKAGFRAPFNVVAAFSQGGHASNAVEVLAARGVPRLAITVHRPDEGATGEEVAGLDVEMQDELRSRGFLLGSQARRAFGAVFTLGMAGIVLGVVAGLGWAYVFSSGLPRLARVVTLAGVAGLAGAAIGFVGGGGGLTRRWGEVHDTDAQLAAERNVLVALHVCDSVLAERTAALLRALGAERVDLVDAHGTPLPPQTQPPPPAEPKGFSGRRET